MDVKEFGRKLREYRKERSLSTHELAEKSGVSQSYISHLESGRKTGMPSPEILKKLADPLGVEYSHLMYDAGHIEEAQKARHEELIRDFGNEDFSNDLFDLKEKIEQIDAVYYKGHPLTNQDRQRVARMLEVLFPEYQ
ncbi:helix-turn-helix domain-containing protein [Paenibacillus agricola]|uniref:Helix-turn-helix transcriptional regulator n=1 Tax=Paenibacillus agricola TaxID=2716264 RepID=A0ABX0JDU8_9BACL|nr:helix-turn-helix transcriptional regulator [Paenibacillus agricola]NHN33565.1 helix-turn-helix transcriptional regulator [Paenibacillus agricola]